MRLEAYTVGFDTRNYHAPIPDDYSKDEVSRRREENISDNIIRYLGEYRLGVKYDEFYYNLEQDTENDDFFLSSSHADPGPILNIYRRAIEYKQGKGLSARREIAECAGFQKLQEWLVDAPEKTLILWVSPPGSRFDGYGVHSFTFVGQVEMDSEGEKRLRIIPYRNVLSLEEHRNYLKYFNENAQFFDKDSDFLANPVIIEQSKTIQAPDDIISFIGETEKFSIEWRNRLYPLIKSLIGGFVQLVKEKASDGELNRARYAIENYTIAIRESLIGDVVNEGPVSKQDVIKTIPYMFQEWGKNTPPAVGGSCGTSNRDSSTLMDYHNGEIKGVVGTLDCVTCPFCNEIVNALLTEDKIICPECNQSANRK